MNTNLYTDNTKFQTTGICHSHVLNILLNRGRSEFLFDETDTHDLFCLYDVAKKNIQCHADCMRSNNFLPNKEILFSRLKTWFNRTQPTILLRNHKYNGKFIAKR
jgi:hypothetical protein